MTHKSPVLLLVFIMIINAACTKDDDPSNDADTYNNIAVLKWNEAASIAVTRTGGLTPMVESRIYAMVNVAMHDVLNNIEKKFNTYALDGIIDNSADPDAALAQAAHDIIVSLLPPQKVYADSLLNVSLVAIPAGTNKDKGIAIGIAAATAMLSKRLNDGAATAQYPIVQGTLPGVYRSTPPFEASGMAALPGWGKVKPFALATSEQFRPVAPYVVNSTAYTTDFNEIKTLGCTSCPARTPEQTQIGLFWLENVPYSWNTITRKLITQNNLSGWQAAHLLALVHIAEADANIGVFDAKYFYNFWRPITAVRMAETDGNANTAGDAVWNVLAPPTPPVPDYPSNHAADGGAAAEVLKRYFGKDDISFSTTSSFLPGITRNYTSLSQAASEVSLSRIYVGYHYRNAIVEGETMGRKIGAFVYDNSLRKLK